MHAYIHTYIHTHIHTYRPIQTDRQTDRQANRQTEKTDDNCITPPSVELVVVDGCQGEIRVDGRPRVVPAAAPVAYRSLAQRLYAHMLSLGRMCK